MDPRCKDPTEAVRLLSFYAQLSDVKCSSQSNNA